MTAPGDVELTVAELREVVAFVRAAAVEVLGVFGSAHPDDPRPAAALDAAQVFVDGAPRSRLQRTAAFEAHRAAAQAHSEPARLAARAAGDAAAAAYLHPIRAAHQVGHVLRADACAARIAELGGANAADVLQRARRRASPLLLEVLRRYPAYVAPARANPVSLFTAELDALLREGR